MRLLAGVVGGGSAGLMAAPLAALQEQLAHVKESMQVAGKITPGVYKHVQSMKALIVNTIEPAIKDSHEGQQKLINLAHESVKDAMDNELVSWANNTYPMLLQNILDQRQIYDDSFTSSTGNHDVCEVEGGKYVTGQKVVRQCECTLEGMRTKTYMHGKGSAVCQYHSASPESCYEAYEDTLLEQLASLEVFRNDKQRYDNQKAQCDRDDKAAKNHKAAAEGARQQCSSAKQAGEDAKEAYETKVRALTKKLETKCNASDTEYNSAVQALTDECDRAFANETDRIAEWNSTQIIKCMLDLYCGGKMWTEEELDKCKDDIQYPYAITCPSTPGPRPPCPTPDPPLPTPLPPFPECCEGPIPVPPSPCSTVVDESCEIVQKFTTEVPSWYHDKCER
mmetsp:Transcript_98395/g.225969  ORF Transcript_98395/g.225969 Transcript_98395/m.225969 type:complete len:394 (+) Transcript_98395:103-1284(+)